MSSEVSYLVLFYLMSSYHMSSVVCMFAKYFRISVLLVCVCVQWAGGQ